MPMSRQSRSPIVLLTRPAAQSQRFAQRLREELGEVAIAISPLMQPEFLMPELPDIAFAALILTSETGVEAARRISAAGQALPGLAFCVGDRTADAARSAGFDALSAKGDANDLIGVMRHHPSPGPFLFLHGTDTRGDIAERLNSDGKHTVARASYTQKEVALSAEAAALLAGDHRLIVPVFSPRSARLLVGARPKDAQSLVWVVAISPAAAAEVALLQPRQIIIADRPDAEAMLHAVAKVHSFVIGA